MTLIDPRVFISHSSKDKALVTRLASDLRRSGIRVWYDQWEIAVGDSIVEKVFDGLKSSDSLVIVLSTSSIGSRWVIEELSTAIMRRLSEQDIRVLPVLIENCEIPISLKHIRYADFREKYSDGLKLLIEAILPSKEVWDRLAAIYQNICSVCDSLLCSPENEDITREFLDLAHLLERALSERAELLIRDGHGKLKYRSFFELIELFHKKGLDVRSKTWIAIVHIRNRLAHGRPSDGITVLDLAKVLHLERGREADAHLALVAGLERMKEIMRIICFE